MTVVELSGLVLESDEVPETWRPRAVRVWFVRLTSEEVTLLLDQEPPRVQIDPEDEPVARLVARGMPAKAIANDLGLTARGVYRRIARLRERFGAGSIPELVAELSRLGLSSSTKIDTEPGRDSSP